MSTTPEPPIGQSPADEFLVGPMPETSELLAEASKLERQIVAAWHEAEPTQEAMARVAVNICALNMASVDLDELRKLVDRG